MLISGSDWHRLADHVEEIRRLEEIAQNIKQGIREAKEMEAGMRSTSSTKDFLDAL